MKLIVSTEIWNTKSGVVSKAVVRTPKGLFIGATNQTKAVPVAKSVKTAKFDLVGR